MAAVEGAEVELVYRDDGIEQRVSLLTGEPAGENIEVLLRSDRRTDLRATRQMDVTSAGTTATITNLDRVVTVRDAELYFFDGAAHPKRTDVAYLHFDLTYYRPGSTECTVSQPCAFIADVVTFRASDGTPYKAQDVNEDPDIVRSVFVVPADTTGGTLIIEGSSPSTATGGISFTAILERTTFEVDFAG